MPHKPYLTAPVKTDKMPKGIPYIVGNEAAERFTYYGLRAILIVYMTQHLLNGQGELAPMSKEEATWTTHTFMAGVYFFAVFGAILSDAFLGKYRTILFLSLVYCFGPLLLVLDQTRLGMYSGLCLIVIGSGGIKPCVSAHVGDQFGATNQHLIPRAFSWFYFSVNVGSTFSMALTPYFLKEFGPRVAFGVPALLMILATFVFWAGRYKFVHIPPAGKTFVKETFSVEGLKSVGKVLPVFLLLPIFWALFDQTASTWVLQAQKMAELSFSIPIIGKEFSVLPEQMQTLNPILILTLIPTFSYLVYPAFNKFFPLTALRRIGLGFFFAAASFLVPAWIQMRIDAGDPPNLAWQVPAYILLTCAEILISITALEFAYTQAPKPLKSLVMSIFLLTITLGNLLTAGVNKALAIPAFGEFLQGSRYFLFFAVLPLIGGILFIFVARRYREQTILHDEAGAPA